VSKSMRFRHRTLGWALERAGNTISLVLTLVAPWVLRH
jgi:hypothetical protein